MNLGKLVSSALVSGVALGAAFFASSCARSTDAGGDTSAVAKTAPAPAVAAAPAEPPAEPPPPPPPKVHPHVVSPEVIALLHGDAADAWIAAEDFSGSAPGWQHRGTEVADGVLRSAGADWQEAVRPFVKPLDLASGPFAFYWACSCDPTAGQDQSALHIKVRLTEDPKRREQLSVNALVRATTNFQMFYVDPGFGVPHVREGQVDPVPGALATKDTVSVFRILTTPAPDDAGALLLSMQGWDPAKGAWVTLNDHKTGKPAEPFRVSYEKDLEGNSHALAMNFMFPHPFERVAGWGASRRTQGD